jgi:hypothetical protein
LGPVARLKPGFTVPKIVTYEPIVGLRSESGETVFLRLYLDDWYGEHEITEAIKCLKSEDLVLRETSFLGRKVKLELLKSTDVHDTSIIVVDSNTNITRQTT